MSSSVREIVCWHCNKNITVTGPISSCKECKLIYQIFGYGLDDRKIVCMRFNINEIINQDYLNIVAYPNLMTVSKSINVVTYLYPQPEYKKEFGESYIEIIAVNEKFNYKIDFIPLPKLFLLNYSLSQIKEKVNLYLLLS